MRIMITEKGDPLFCATDVTSMLKYKNGRKAIYDNCVQKGVTTSDTPTNGGVQALTYINESNLYRLIMRSKLPEAAKFQDWVCEEVLPSIRKNGGYIQTKPDDTPEMIMAKALLLADSTIKSQKMIIEAQAPKVIFADSVASSNKSILIGELAKIITQNGYKIGQNTLIS